MSAHSRGAWDRASAGHLRRLLVAAGLPDDMAARRRLWRALESLNGLDPDPPRHGSSGRTWPGIQIQEREAS